MSRIKNVIIGAVVILFILPGYSEAQFYNGHQMTFGKNRVQYNTFYWKYYRFDRYDVYSYDEGRELSLYVADYLEDELPRIERFFDYNFEKRLIFIVYNKLSDFKQSNIGQLHMDDEQEANVGGVTRIIQNKIFVYFEGNHNRFNKQITETLAEALIYEMLYGNDFRDNFTGSTLLNLPEWYIKGLVSYISNPWDFELENRVKDGIVSERFEKFNRLEGKDAVYAGHSFWKYIADNFGESVIPNIIYLTRINKNINQGFYNVLGLTLKDLSNEWLGYYTTMYLPQENYRELPDDGQVLKRYRKKTVYSQVKISPTGNHIAYTTNKMGRYKVWLYDTRTDKKRKLERQGHMIEQITDYSYPVIAWHPSGRIVAWLEEEKGELRLTTYDLDLDEYSSRLFVYFEKIMDFSYSDDGLKFLISGVYRGQTDIYVHDIVTGTNDQITNDIADDLNPRFYDNSTKIIFTSNRKSDTLNNSTNPSSISENFNVYLYDLEERPGVLKRVNDRDYSTRKQPYVLEKNKFLYLSDKNGILNRYLAEYDSVISFIDTTTHYRYFARTKPLTNYRRNIIEHHITSEANQYSQVIYHDGRYKMFTGSINPEDVEEDIRVTPFKEKYALDLEEKDSIQNIRRKRIPMEDVIDNHIISGEDTLNLGFSEIDVNNYVFEKEKLSYYNERLAGNNLKIVMDTVQETERQRYIDYETTFYTNYLVNQVDFSFLNESYQTFTGGAVYYNPGFNLLFKVGANDLFEDYRIIGGVRFATDFNSNEYLLSFEDMKNRWDKQFIFHRQVFNANTETSLLKTYAHELRFILKYPFSQVARIEGTAIYRSDKSVFLSTDLSNLNENSTIKPWAGVRLAYVFDNTRSLGLNLYQGLRYKIFAEAYNQIDKKKSDLFVLGADFRHYTRIHRSLIWANRFAASTSFGNTPLIYYLGSVDNWTNFNPTVQTFDRSVPIDYSKNYAFQTLATNMRGFTQNIRNGNNFALINTELRWPIIRYIANRPLSSSFLNNLQLIGFFDAGTAWAGLHPWVGENEYDIEEYVNGPVKVVVDSNRDPLVAGYGFGARTRLFGYFVRVDWAWGIENGIILPRIFYFSLNLDF